MNRLLFLLVLNFIKSIHSYRYSTNLVIKNRFSGATPIALGTESFLELLQKSDIFFDKTPIMHYLLFIDFNVKVIYLPAKWGKSTNLHMMKMFFEEPVDKMGTPLKRNASINHRLFKYGEIPELDGSIKKLRKRFRISGWDMVKELQGQFPVIYLRLGNLSATTLDEFVNRLGDRIRTSFLEHSYFKNLLERKNANQRFHYLGHYSNFTKILDRKYDQETLRNSLRLLSELQYDHFKKKVFALIDDFENILFNMLVDNTIPDTEISSIISFYSSFLLTSFKDNECLRYTVVMGTFRLMKLISADEENKDLKELKATNTPTRRIYAVSKDEREELFEYLKLPPEFISRILSWYEGYLSDDLLSGTYLIQDSLAKFLVTEHLQFDQSGSYGDRILSVILKHKTFRNSLRCLIDGKMFLSPYRRIKRENYLEDYLYFRKRIHQGEDIEIRDLNIWNLLNSCGYLTIVQHVGCKGSQFRIPNNEIRMEISQKLMNYYIDHFNVPSSALENAVNQMAQLVTNDQTKPTELIQFLQNMLDNDALFGDFARATQEHIDYPPTLKIIRFFITYLTLRVVLMLEDYQTEPMSQLQYREEDMRSVRADSILNNTDRAVFILINDKAPSASHVIEEVKTHQEVKRFKEMDYIKLVGINVVANRIIDIEAQLMKNPFKNSDDAVS
ncbi:uncharacterized protein LOC135836773 [Planococcus citri]|uniref:uncharacterized protein LOC135836773 n=1 Tax=Planococcus citri TaxID=170843 RepID=UPI0031F8D0AF